MKKKLVLLIAIMVGVLACLLMACNQPIDDPDVTDPNDSGTTTPTHVHDYGDWVKTETEHYKQCKECGAKINRQIHKFGDLIEEGDKHYQKCSVCGAETAREDHVFGDFVPFGEDHCKKCACGAETGRSKHTFSTEYKSDSIQHYRECAVCGAKTDNDFHTNTTIEWKISNAEHYKEGSACSVCGSGKKEYHNFVNGVCSDCGFTSEEIVGLKFELKSDDTYEVNGVVDTSVGGLEESDMAIAYSITKLVIPDMYQGKPVTSIKKRAFTPYYQFLEELVIGDNITSIGESAFEYCTNLRFVKLGKNVNSISVNAFNSCDKLLEICNNSSLTLSIGSSEYGLVAQFAKNIITDLEDSKIHVEGDFVFYVDEDEDQYYLIGYIGENGNIELPTGYKGGEEGDGHTYEIYSYAFYSLGIYTIEFSKGVTKIGRGAFDGCSLLYYVGLNEGITDIETEAFAFCESLLTITIPKTVKTVKANTFMYCFSMVTAIFPNTLESIESSSFVGCTDIHKILFKGKTSEWGKYGWTDERIFGINHNTSVFYYSEEEPWKNAEESGYTNWLAPYFWHYVENSDGELLPTRWPSEEYAAVPAWDWGTNA